MKISEIVTEALNPVKATQAAGFDFKSAYDYIPTARCEAIISTCLRIDLPEGCYGRIAPRSQLAFKHFVDV